MLLAMVHCQEAKACGFPCTIRELFKCIMLPGERESANLRMHSFVPGLKGEDVVRALGPVLPVLGCLCART